MILNYSVPQTEIAQILESTANPLLDRIHAVVVGPAYVHADTDAGNLVNETYQEGGELSYKRATETGVSAKGSEAVDADAVLLHATNLRLRLFEDNANFAPLSYDTSGNIIFYEAGVLDTEDADIAGAFDAGRPPTPGDTYRISGESGTPTPIERRVLGLLGKDLVSALGDSSYVGALGAGSSAADEIAVSYSNFSAPAATVTAGAAAELYARRFGRVGLAANGGLRLVVEVTCLTAGASPTFSSAVNGLPANVVRTTVSGPKSRFTLLTDLAIDVTRTALQWAAGDRIVFFVDVAQSVDTALLDSAYNLSNYTYANSKKRVASSITLEVLSLSDSGAPIVRLSDSAGLLKPVTLTLAESANTASLTYDTATVPFSLTLHSGDFALFHVGQRYIQPVTPPSRSATFFDKVVLSAPIGGDLGGEAALTVTASALFSGTLPASEPVLGGTNYTVGSENVTLGSLSAAAPGYPALVDAVRFAEDGKGTVAVQWRAVIPVGITEGVVAIDSAADIVNNFGSYQMGSELGYGLFKALGGSQGKRVYALNTGGDTLEDFIAAFTKLEAVRSVYTIGVLTENEQVMQLAAQHVRAMSLPTVKRFRRAYVGTDSPGEYPIVDLQEDENAYTASISAGTGGAYNLVTFSQPTLDLTQHAISRGDKLVLTGSGQTYVIDRVTGENTLVLVSGPAAPVSTTSCKVIAADTPANTARFVWGRSERLGANAEEDRRISNIWQHEGTLAGKRIPNRFGACEIAGARTALQPQQGLTRMEVSFIDSAPAMYTSFRASLLDEMASHGVWIITQNSADSVPFVRHQLTTATSNGSLYYEDNAGTNVDTVCFAMDDLTDPLIGKRNATPKTVAEIKNLLHDLLSDLTQADYTSVLGAQLVAFYNANGDTDTLDVEINKYFKDLIDVHVVLEVPLPLNTVRIVVLARTIKNDGVAVSSLSANVVSA